MDIWLIVNGLMFIGGIILCLAPFDKRRIRAAWAKVIFVLCGIIGITMGAIHSAWDLQWFTVTHERSLQLHVAFAGIEGAGFGLLLSLVLSGQASGKKLPDTALEPTAAAP